MKKTILIVGASLALSSLAAAEAPRMSLRLRGPHTATTEQWKKTFAAIAENPGCCDEVWFSTGIGVPPVAWHREQAARLVAAAADLRRIGVVPSLQFQATLGHGDELSASEDCSAKNWTGWTGSTGVEDKYCSCPRQSAFLAYVRATAEAYAAMRPGSVWIDDDLRYVNHLPATDGSRLGCWCATCLAAFSAQEGKAWTRVALDETMNDNTVLAARWEAFSAKSLAEVARMIAEAFRRLSPETRLGLQCCFQEKFVSPVRAVTKALAEASGKSVGLRPGGGAYYDFNPCDQVVKSIEAVQFRAKLEDLGCVDVWCPEVESWPRAYSSRSAQSAIVECFVALAYGFNSTSLLVLDTRYEDDALYSKTMLKPLADAAPVLKAMARANEGAAPAGFLLDAADPEKVLRTAIMGVPVLPGVGRSLGVMTKRELETDVFQTGSKDIQALRDALSARATGDGAPATLETPFVGLMVPHVTTAGALRTVALLNTRIDAQGPVTLRLRGVPADATLVWRALRRAPAALAAKRDGDVVRVTIPEIDAWNGGFIDVSPSR